MIKIPRIPNSRTLSIKSGFRGSGHINHVTNLADNPLARTKTTTTTTKKTQLSHSEENLQKLSDVDFVDFDVSAPAFDVISDGDDVVATPMTSIAQLVNRWKNVTSDGEKLIASAPTRHRRQALSAERGLAPFVARHVKTVLRHLETVILHLEDLLRDMKYVD